MDKLKDAWNDFMMEAITPKQAASYMFDENASLTIDIEIDSLDGTHIGREKIEELLVMIIENDNLQMSDATIEKIQESPEGINIVGFDLGPKLIDANLTLNDEGKIILGRIFTSGNQIRNCYFSLINFKWHLVLIC